ncbi:hypothetical protein WJX77_010509 [Trebouxia sp. C0004]
MGAGWRRFTEKARQKWHITADKGFASSSNARNELMLRDAGEFAGHIKRCEKDIRILKNATEGLINTTKAVMSAPLPKVYEDCGNGTAQPIATTQGLSGAIGGDFKVDELQRVSKETAKKLEAEVLAPMQRWTTAYNTVQARMNKLEGVRLEVDSRRRTVAELGQKIDKQRARLPQTKVKGEFDIEQTIKKVQHKENKLAAARQSFKEQEALVYQQLAQLIRDAVWLKSYIAAVMRLEQEAFQSAYASLGPSKATLPLQQEMPAQSEQMMMTTGSTISQPMNMAPQVGSTGLMSSVTNKIRKQPSGKENGAKVQVAAVSNKEYIDMPSVPANRITRAPGSVASTGYDRYGEQPQYAQQQVWAA